MRVSICDDEKELRTSLKKIVERELQLQGIVYEITEYSSGEELLEEVKKEEPDLLFLDIEMGGISGMDAARQLRKSCRNTVLVFVTAYPDFVFQGYEVHAFHYILKPYKEQKICEVLQKAIEQLDTLEERFFIIEQKAGTVKLPLKKIHYFKSDRKKAEAVLDGKTESFYGKLSEIEEGLPDYFVRSHNRYLVNLNYITRVEKNMCVCGEEELPVSRGCRQELSVAFAKMMLR